MPPTAQKSAQSCAESVEGVTQVNPKAFNAFTIWRDGKGDPILEYPAGYDVLFKKFDSDGVFYVPRKAYWRPPDTSKFIGDATEDVQVEDDVLTYPTKKGRSLALKFSAFASKKMGQDEAVKYCKDLGLRLPHVQELLDFCAAGISKDRHGQYSLSTRCSGYTWSASLDSDDSGYAWLFRSFNGIIINNFRSYSSGVRCVGAP